MAAASSTKYHIELKVAAILIFFFIYDLLLVPAVELTSPGYDTESTKERGKLVGSRPPGCVNKCLSCKPCIATLVIEPHDHDHQYYWKTFRPSSLDDDDIDSYYLLSWKWKCENKLFQP